MQQEPTEGYYTKIMRQTGRVSLTHLHLTSENVMNQIPRNKVLQTLMVAQSLKKPEGSLLCSQELA
jgi:hypothetical protein